MLNVERPPPVPHVSMNGPSGPATGWACARTTAARPAISSALSLRPQRDQEAGGLRVAGLAGHHGLQALLGHGAADVLAGPQLVDGT